MVSSAAGAVAGLVVAAAVALVAAVAAAGGLVVGRHTFHLLFGGQPAPAVADPAAPDLPTPEVLVERLELAFEGLELVDAPSGVGQLAGDGVAEPRLVGGGVPCSSTSDRISRSESPSALARRMNHSRPSAAGPSSR